MISGRRDPDPSVLANLIRCAAASPGGWSIASAGSSMHPRIAAGTSLRIVACDRRPRLGEVWAFVNASNRVIAHRYLRRTRRGRYVFFGDAAGRADDPIRGEWLIGLVIEVHGEDGIQRLARRSAISPVIVVVLRGIRRRIGRFLGRTS